MGLSPSMNKLVGSTTVNKSSKATKRSGIEKETGAALEAPRGFTAQNWSRKIEVALQARRASQSARKDKAMTFSTGRFSFNNDRTV